MRHEHHVASLVVLAVEGEEIDLAQHGSGTDDAVAVAEKVVTEDMDQAAGVTGLAAGSDNRVELFTSCLPASLLECVNNLGRL
jgi:hypothetical protein